jgi:hypothetical protein
MKRIIFTLLGISLLLTSCQQEIETNNEPGFLSKKNGEIWQSEALTVKKNGSALVIEVSNGLEKIFLNTSSTSVGTYVFGTSNASNLGIFTQNIDGTLVTYKTNVVEGPVKSIFGIVNSGLLYVSGIANTTSTGNGQGLRVKTTVTNGVIQSIDLAAPGQGYKSGDLVTILGGNNSAVISVKDVISSNGFVKITKNIGGIIEGQFQFTAKRIDSHPFAEETVTFSNGNFYNLNTN